MPDRLVIGCGYLGRRVAEQWQARGDRVFVTTRSPERAAAWSAQGLVPVVCDVLAPDTLQSLPAVASVVYCVGMERTAGRSMREVYVAGLGKVLAELTRPERALRPERFLYVSSTGVYGQTGGDWVDEDAATQPRDEAGRVVLEAEELLRRSWPEAIVLRFAGIYGPGRVIGKQLLQSGQPIPGAPDGWLNLIHVEDGAGAVLAAEERGRPGALYHVADGRPVRRQDYYAALARLLRSPAPTFAPGASERGNRRIDNTRLRQELGFVPRWADLERGLADALARETAT
jgi:nucleoside-diphosphate-sugar epimerase